MRLNRIETGIHVDTDVVVTMATRVRLPWMDPRCDSCISKLDAINGSRRCGDWYAWAGTSVLTQRVLREFVHFSLHLYRRRYLQSIWSDGVYKSYPQGFNDMTSWYLFAVVADPKVRMRTEAHVRKLPRVRRNLTLCAMPFQSGWIHDDANTKLLSEKGPLHPWNLIFNRDTLTLDTTPTTRIVQSSNVDERGKLPPKFFHFQGDGKKHIFKYMMPNATLTRDCRLHAHDTVAQL